MAYMLGDQRHTTARGATIWFTAAGSCLTGRVVAGLQVWRRAVSAVRAGCSKQRTSEPSGQDARGREPGSSGTGRALPGVLLSAPWPGRRSALGGEPWSGSP